MQLLALTTFLAPATCEAGWAWNAIACATIIRHAVLTYNLINCGKSAAAGKPMMTSCGARGDTDAGMDRGTAPWLEMSRIHHL